MKNILFSIILLGILIIPFTSEAHMIYQENVDQLQNSMNAMMQGEELTETELQEMASFMERSGEYNTMPYNQMMSTGTYYPHHTGITGSFMYWGMPILMIVWLLVGILLIITLTKKILSQKHE